MRKTQLAFCLIAASLLGVNQFAPAADPAHPEQSNLAPTEAIAKLKEGNGRYAGGNQEHPRQAKDRRAELTKGQHPFVIVIGCADSRIPPEIVFDQGLGDIFVTRAAGNVIDDHALGSIEYAVDHFGTRLIVVLGHQDCGAVKATKETVAAKGKAPGHIQSLITAIKPAVEATRGGDLQATIDANTKNVVNALRSSTPILKPKVDSGEVRVIGGYYSLGTGAVTLLDEK